MTDDEQEDLLAMANCLILLREELMQSGIIGPEVPPMFVAESVTAHFQVLTNRAEQAEVERDHWKANHADIVKRAALLSQRPDLPVDRLPAYGEMAILQRKVRSMQAEIDRLTELLK